MAFAARRRTDGEEGAKYVNSPASPVYSKSRVLYALDRAGEAIRERRFVFVTEGYKDALAMHAAGFTNTVALCGVASLPGISGCWRDIRSGSSCCWMPTGRERRRWKRFVAMLSCGTDPEGERLEPACLFEVSRMQASLRGGPRDQPAAWIGLRLFPPSDHHFPSFGFAGNLRTPPASADRKDRERFISLSFM